MQRNSLILLCGFALLLALIFIAKLSSTQSDERERTSTSETSHVQNDTLPPHNREVIDEHVNTQKPSSRPSLREPRKTNSHSAHQAQADIKRSAEKHLKKILTRDDSLITKETLADGTELFHLNGSYAHVSTASIDTDGNIHTGCHDNHESLEAHAHQQSNDTNNLPIDTTQ